MVFPCPAASLCMVCSAEAPVCCSHQQMSATSAGACMTALPMLSASPSNSAQWQLRCVRSLLSDSWVAERGLYAGQHQVCLPHKLRTR